MVHAWDGKPHRDHHAKGIGRYPSTSMVGRGCQPTEMNGDVIVGVYTCAKPINDVTDVFLKITPLKRNIYSKDLHFWGFHASCCCFFCKAILLCRIILITFHQKCCCSFPRVFCCIVIANLLMSCIQTLRFAGRKLEPTTWRINTPLSA